MKRFFAVALLAVLLMLFACAQAETLNLLQNGSFEILTDSGEPEGWYATAYRNQPGYSRIKVTDEFAYSGRYSAVIENASSNDARYIYTASVEPDTLYRLSGYVRVESMEDVGNGANFGIEGIYAFSDCLFDTDGTWQPLEWYGVTGKDQTKLTFGIRVGGYSAESVGKAYFDDIVLEKIDELPSEVIASLWYDANASQGNTSSTQADSDKSTAAFVLLGVLFAVFCFIIRPYLDGQNEHASTIALCLLMLLALVLRIVLGMNVAGYEVDINCFTAWSLRMAERGPAAFYAENYFCDYPPGAMLLLWPVGLLLRAVGLQNGNAALLIVKLLPILCDLLGGWCVYWFARKHLSQGGAAVLSALYLLNPAALVNGAAWGQMDSVLALLILLTTLLALQKAWRWAIPLFVLSALVKPQALLFAPLGGIWLILSICAEKEESQRMLQLKSTGLGVALALGTAVVIVLPFSIHQEWDWLFKLYQGTLSSYAYATLNTANLYYLIGANWAGLAQNAPGWLMIAGACVFGLLAVLLLNENVQRRLNLQSAQTNTLVLIFAAIAVVQIVFRWLNVSYAVYGYAMMAFVYLFAVICLLHRPQKGMLPFAMTVALIGVYVLGVKIHERYLFPALVLLLISYALTRDRRVLVLYAGFSITTFINTAIVLDNSILFGAEYGHLNTDTLTLNNVLCILNLLLCFYGAWIAVSGLRASKPLSVVKREDKSEKPHGYREMLLHPKNHRLHLQWQDYALMLVITAAYAVLTFSHLGSTVAPQTAWVSTSADEAVVLKLNEKSKFSVLYYAGVSYYDFSIQVSDDGVNWSEAYPCKMREGLCYRWNYAVKSTTENGKTSYNANAPANVLWLEGEYLKVNACNAGLNLWEVIARDENGENLPFSLIDHTGGHPELLDESQPPIHLIDETDTCVGEPSWFNGTYFDEIYHARTGYEHLHGLAPYETTHPPLGKLMMAAGIALFGMTPFGWRFAGALIGVLMLPALYLLGYQITRKRSVAALSMLAFSLDLMHFTQTRIATIDSFPVFFILLSYWFMVRYMQTDVFETSSGEEKLICPSYLRTLVPLLFSGICMGLSIASKWIGLYSAVGLAILFFLTVYRQYRASQTAWDMVLEETAFSEHEHARIRSAQKWTVYRILITCGFCVIFFVLIPFVIYYLSYIPYLSPTGSVTIKRLIDAQIGMLRYHSTPGLGMDHPFQSPWWQWPFILKPMWFAQDAFEPAGYASTIMCMGNPWIFYIGAVAMAIVLIACIAKYVRICDGKAVLRKGDGDLTLLVLVIAFCAQYLPWVLVPRSMYIYHYFASVPFIILASGWLLDHLPKTKPALRYGVFAVYLLGAFVFFVMFFPYASGYLTSTQWLDAMKWFPRIYY